MLGLLRRSVDMITMHYEMICGEESRVCKWRSQSCVAGRRVNVCYLLYLVLTGQTGLLDDRQFGTNETVIAR